MSNQKITSQSPALNQNTSLRRTIKAAYEVNGHNSGTGQPKGRKMKQLTNKINTANKKLDDIQRQLYGTEISHDQSMSMESLGLNQQKDSARTNNSQVLYDMDRGQASKEFAIEVNQYTDREDTPSEKMSRNSLKMVKGGNSRNGDDLANDLIKITEQNVRGSMNRSSMHKSSIH